MRMLIPGLRCKCPNVHSPLKPNWALAPWPEDALSVCVNAFPFEAIRVSSVTAPGPQTGYPLAPLLRFLPPFVSLHFEQPSGSGLHQMWTGPPHRPPLGALSLPNAIGRKWLRVSRRKARLEMTLDAWIGSNLFASLRLFLPTCH